jgi:hypothetical protein
MSLSFQDKKQAAIAYIREQVNEKNMSANAFDYSNIYGWRSMGEALQDIAIQAHSKFFDRSPTPNWIFYEVMCAITERFYNSDDSSSHDLINEAAEASLLIQNLHSSNLVKIQKISNDVCAILYKDRSFTMPTERWQNIIRSAMVKISNV